MPRPKNIWYKSCPDVKTITTRYILLLALGIAMMVWSFWSMDWAMTHQVSGNDVQFFDWTFSPSGWMNIAWAVLTIGIFLSMLSALKIGYLRCRGE